LHSYHIKRRNFLDATRLGQLLIDGGIITYDQLQDALVLQKSESLQMARPPRPLGQILVGMGYCTELQIAETLGEQDALRVQAEQFEAQQKPWLNRFMAVMTHWFKQAA
jgi:hypothetical protein